MPTDPVSLAGLAALVLIAAALYSSVGQAGASGYLAAMALYGVAPAAMKPTALALNILVAIIGTARFGNAGHTPWRMLIPLCFGSVPAAFIGGRIALAPCTYEPLVAALLILAAIRLWFPGELRGSATQASDIACLAVGAALGFIAGLTGIGGGVFLAPILILTGWETPRRAAGASAPFILVNSISGLLGHISAAREVPPQAAVLIAAAVVGGFAGSWLGSQQFHPLALKRVLAVAMLIASTKLLATAF
jgi:uncharacterized membrane protein YfcA